MRKFTVLMIDDHPSQIEGYKAILKYNDGGYIVDTTECYDCESAYNVLHAPDRPDFELVFIDKNMPGFEREHIHSGEDLARVVRNCIPSAKIIIITSFTEAFVLYTIMKQIAPEGLMVKSDFKPDELLAAFECVAAGGKYYTETVRNSLQHMLAKKEYLDSFNRKIITLLGQGIKTKSMPNHLNLSLSAIEKRKAHIKDYFCIENGNDEDIVREAKRLGYI